LATWKVTETLTLTKEDRCMMQTMWSRAAVLAAALVLGAGPALAGGQKSTTGGSDQYKAGDKPAGSSASPRTEGAGDFTGRHTMEGEVTRIDPSKGTMSLKTAEGTMDLHFPPSALANIKKGDRVAVELALRPSGGSASPRTEKMPSTKK
jgi:hypothetical protein